MRIVGPLIRRTASIPPACRFTGQKIITSNSRYFAYGSAFSACIYSRATLELIWSYTVSEALVHTIRFATLKHALLAVGYNDATVAVLRCDTREVIDKMDTITPLISLCWIKHDVVLAGFTVDGELVSWEPGVDLYCHRIAFDFVPIPIIVSSQDDDQTIIVLGGDSQMILVNFTAISVNAYSEYSAKLCSLDIDPASPSTCLACWQNGEWGIFNLSATIELIKKTKCGVKSSGAIWIGNPPGHLVTGDSDRGILRFWEPAADVHYETVSLNQAGFVELQRMDTGLALFTFADGRVMMYDVDRRLVVWDALGGHTNTIFSISFHPMNPDVLVSCGYEGAICTWNLNTMHLINRIASAPWGIYSATATLGGGYVICGGADGMIGAFSLETGRMIWDMKLSEGRVLSIAADPTSSNLVLSACNFGVCHLIDIETRSIIWSSNPNLKARGCAFSSVRAGAFAVACFSGALLIGHKSTLPGISTLNLTRSELYIVQWSPVLDYQLLTSANDGVVLLWDIRPETQSVTRIVSHEGPSRPISFHPQFPWMAASGGYDGQIILFDIKTPKVLAKIQAHDNHIYGLSFSPNHPLLLVSSSRDTAIHCWSIDRVVIDFCLSETGEPILRPLPGIAEFLRIVGRMNRNKDRIVYEETDQVHINDLCRLTRKRVQQAVGGQQERNPLKRAINHSERMAAAARLELLAGNRKRYCELLFAAGEVDKALAGAASVSVRFWQELTRKRLKLYTSQNSIANGLSLIGERFQAAHCLVQGGQYADALLVAAAARSRRYLKIETVNSIPPANEGRPYVNRTFENNEDLSEYSIASQLSATFLASGHIMRAASALLSVGDVDSACHLLVRNGEFLAALYLDRTFNLENWRVAEILRRLTGSTTESGDALAQIALLRREVQRPIWDFTKCREMSRALEAIARSVNTENLAEIAGISLYLATFEAAWKGFAEIYPLLIETGQKLAGESPSRGYLLGLFEKQQRFTVVGPAAAACRPAGHLPFTCDVSLTEGQSMTRQMALMWSDVTSFAPGSLEQIIVW
jgi:WD40 repeat protein